MIQAADLAQRIRWNVDSILSMSPQKIAAEIEKYGICCLSVEEAELIISVLKAQEPVKPHTDNGGGGVTWWLVCGACKAAINPNDKFCHECGRPVLWE